MTWLKQIRRLAWLVVRIDNRAVECECCGTGFIPKDTYHDAALDGYCPDCRWTRCDALPAACEGPRP